MEPRLLCCLSWCLLFLLLSTLIEGPSSDPIDLLLCLTPGGTSKLLCTQQNACRLNILVEILSVRCQRHLCRSSETSKICAADLALLHYVIDAFAGNKSADEGTFVNGLRFDRYMVNHRCNPQRAGSLFFGL